MVLLHPGCIPTITEFLGLYDSEGDAILSCVISEEEGKERDIEREAFSSAPRSGFRRKNDDTMILSLLT